jgi:hypothetical protein
MALTLEQILTRMDEINVRLRELDGLLYPLQTEQTKIKTELASLANQAGEIIKAKLEGRG